MAHKPCVQLFKERIIASRIIDYRRSEIAKRSLIRLACRASIKIRGLHTTMNGTLATNCQRSTDNQNFISQAKSILKTSRGRNLDNRKGITGGRNRTTNRIENPKRKLFNENGVHKVIEPCDRIRRSESSRSEDAAANAALLIQNIPAKFLREGIDDIGAWHIQRFGKLVQIDKHGAMRFEIAAGSRLTRSNIAQDKNGKHQVLPNANGSYYRANTKEGLKIQPNSKTS